MLRKGVYPFEYMDSWEKIDETLLPDKEVFYSKLNEEGISNIDYVHAQKIWQAFEIKNLGKYNDFYVQCDTLLFADVFEKFRDKCIEIYELDPAHFLSASRWAWQACLKKTGVKLELLTDYDMLLMVKKGIWGGMCQAIHRYAKENSKYINSYDKSIISSFLMYLDAKNLYGWAIIQKLPVNGFKWVKNLSKLNERFIKDYNENSDREYFLEIDAEYPKNLLNSHKDLPKIGKRQEACLWYRRQKEICCTHKSFKTSTKSRRLKRKKST